MKTQNTTTSAARDAGFENLKTTGASRIYRRDTIATLPPPTNKSVQYSRKQARDIFERYAGVDIVEYVSSGLKMDSQVIGRGDKRSPSGCWVIVCSTGGKWGKSRRDFPPATIATFYTK